jgi:branched-chain amino acid transport system permease protein
MPITARYFLIFTGLLLALWPLAAPGALYFQVLGMACLYGVLAVAWNLYALSGAVSLGHGAFFGLGAYGAALLSLKAGWTPLWAAPLGALCALAFGAVWGLAFQRLRGVYLGLATLAAAEIPRVIVDNWDSLTQGSLGLVGIPGLPGFSLGGWEASLGMEGPGQYYFLLLLLIGAALLHYWAMRSRWGWAVRAVRENETAAAMLGVNVFGRRFQALLLSAYVTGLCGGLYAHILGLIEPSLVFGLHLSALPLVLTIFGGRYQVLGPVLGALILYPVDQLLLRPLMPTGHLAIYGLIIILAILKFPRGLAAWLTPRPPSS